jgi:hypothetical protein
MSELSDDDLYKLMQYSPMLDEVEAAIGNCSEVDASVALQRDAGNIYAGLTPDSQVTTARVKQVFGELYLAYCGTLHNVHTFALRDMMNDLGIQPAVTASSLSNHR